MSTRKSGKVPQVLRSTSSAIDAVLRVQRAVQKAEKARTKENKVSAHSTSKQSKVTKSTQHPKKDVAFSFGANSPTTKHREKVKRSAIISREITDAINDDILQRMVTASNQQLRELDAQYRLPGEMVAFEITDAIGRANRSKIPFKNFTQAARTLEHYKAYMDTRYRSAFLERVKFIKLGEPTVSEQEMREKYASEREVTKRERYEQVEALRDEGAAMLEEMTGIKERPSLVEVATAFKMKANELVSKFDEIRTSMEAMQKKHAKEMRKMRDALKKATSTKQSKEQKQVTRAQKQIAKAVKQVKSTAKKQESKAKKQVQKAQKQVKSATKKAQSKSKQTGKRNVSTATKQVRNSNRKRNSGKSTKANAK